MEISKADIDERSKKMALLKTLVDRKSIIRLGTLVWGETRQVAMVAKY